MRKVINKIIKPFGYVMLRQRYVDRLSKCQAAHRDMSFLQAMPPGHAGELFGLLPESKSQLRQDLFVLSELGFKRGGFFVEFGAASGLELSNTWLMEKKFGWSGILAEPARCWHAQLAANRSCLVEHDCVWSKTGQQLDFAEADEAEISTLSDFKDADMHSKSRRSSRHYGVRTISLNDMLEKHSAPRDIDYLSIDTEGSELEILSSLDFNKYQFKAITCEHNHTASRALIHDLLSGAGYVRKFTELSDFDDWYVKR
jgi:FkbM family methyltransferase